MTITKSTFRWVLVLQLCLVPLAIWVHEMTRANLPPDVLDFLKQQHPHPVSLHDLLFLLFGSGYLLAWVVCYIGLFLLLRFSRPLFVALVLGGLLLDPFLSLQIKSGWDVLISDILGILGAITYVLIYFSPLKEHFAGKTELESTAG
jgi:hypothetical protein